MFIPNERKKATLVEQERYQKMIDSIIFSIVKKDLILFLQLQSSAVLPKIFLTSITK